MNNKKFKRAMARYGMFFSAWLGSILPYSAVKAITGMFIAVGLRFTKHLQAVARESLRLAFAGEKTDEEIEQIVHDCFVNFGRGMMDMIYYMHRPNASRGRVDIEGKENLDEALKEGKGVIIVTAHFGNFPLMMTHLAQEGYPLNCLMRRTRDPKIDDFLLRNREKLGVKTIFSEPRRECVQKSFKALRDNELLFILMDQHFGSEGGVFVDFFGQKAATAPGPVIFAQRTGARIVPMFIIRQPQDRYKIIMDRPFPLVENENQEEMIYQNVAALSKLIEGHIRQHPHEWGWMHRRWKTQQPVGRDSVPKKE